MDLAHVGKLCYLMLPVILGGIFNMVLVKLPVLEGLKTPMDRGRIMADGRRLWGDNKTWKGFLGMIVLTAFFMACFHMLYRSSDWARSVSLIPYGSFPNLGYSLFWGAVWGFGYVLFELPNSYVKRRINIDPGKKGGGVAGKVFTVVDQADSVIGCVIFLMLFYRPTLIDALVIVVLATLFHYVINILLYLVGLKKQAG